MAGHRLRVHSSKAAPANRHVSDVVRMESIPPETNSLADARSAFLPDRCADWTRIAAPAATSPSSGSSTWNTADARDSGTADATETTTDSPHKTTARRTASNRNSKVNPLPH